jgi:hypothetical protein
VYDGVLAVAAAEVGAGGVPRRRVKQRHIPGAHGELDLPRHRGLRQDVVVGVGLLGEGVDLVCPIQFSPF